MEPVLWLIAGAILLASEILSGDFVLAMLGAAALAAAGVAVLDPSVWLQAGTFAVLSLGLIFFARPAIKRRMFSHKGLETNVDALIGKKALVESTVDAHDGRVRIGGDVWSARALDETQVMEVGRTVTVMEIKGAIAVVWAEP